MRWLVKGKFRFLRGQRGLTLLEVLIAVSILALIGVGVVRAIDTNARASRTLDEQVVATNLATAYLEALRELPYDNAYPNEYSNINVDTPPGYSANITVVYTNDYKDDGTTVWVDEPPGSKELQRIRVSVSRENGKPVLSICTFKTGF
ncbi:prepilin-type N-terminal cleavage/methylation domain-containing protein [Chloroflexota bacterium]